MYKQTQFFGKTDSGIFCQGLFGSAGAFEKTAGAAPFSDWETGDELRRYIAGITRADRQKYCYVLVNALGAGEYFGSNINADYFPWNSLAHEGDDYGYKTFLRAHAFQHHKNKDPERAFGIPVLSVLNTRMKRVELIVRLDREKARAEGADGIITRIDKGEFPDVSMGCKVPYDECYVCLAKSKTQDDYCIHMKPPEELRHLYGPNRLMPDGRRICVINRFPRFFDISFVFIGADKTAKVMAKLASVGNQVCLGDVCAVSRHAQDVVQRPSGIYVPSSYSVEKVASAKEESCDCDCGTCGGMDKIAEAFGVKVAAKSKAAEIVKQVPAGSFAMKSLPALEAGEPDIPREVLDRMADHSVGDVVSTTGAAGVVLKPREFQRIVLVRMGEGGLADELDSNRQIFRQVPQFDDSIQMDPKDRIIRALLHVIKGMVQDRSCFGEPFARRTIAVAMVPKKPLPTETAVAHPLLDKISAAYNGYRRSMLTKMSQAVEAAHSDPQLREMLQGNQLVNAFSKTASVPFVSLDSMAYVAGAYLKDGLLSNSAVAEMAAASNPWILG